MVYHQSITIGQYFFFTGVIGFMIWPLQHLGRLIVQLSHSFVSYRRIVDILRHRQEDLTDGVEQQEERLDGEVVFNHVFFFF